MMKEETKFHWAEGMKYALEGIKALFILNGAATVSILTFIGKNQSGSDLLVYSMFCFAIGAVTGPISLFLAYLTQLKYGNSVIGGPDPESDWGEASKLHNLVYIPICAGLIFFILGVFLAGGSFVTSAEPSALLLTN